MAVLAQTARAHIQRAKILGKSLDERLKKKAEASDEFTVDEDYRRDFKMVTEALQHGGKMLENALDAEAKQNAGFTEAQLKAQFQAEVIQAATTMTESDWNLMKDARV